MWQPVLNLAQVEFLLHGAMWTVGLSAIAFVGGSLLGCVIALARIASSAALRWIAASFIQLVQGTPLIVTLFIFYFGLSIFGLDQLPAIVAAACGLTVYAAAFLGEIWRGCLQAVPKTQWEAAECLALTRWQRMTRVILPQAARIATGPTVGFLVQIVKNTSLASVVGFIELTQAGKLVNSTSFDPFVVYLIVAAIYFSICFPLSWWSRRLERKFNVGRS